MAELLLWQLGAGEGEWGEAEVAQEKLFRFPLTFSLKIVRKVNYVARCLRTFQIKCARNLWLPLLNFNDS